MVKLVKKLMFDKYRSVKERLTDWSLPVSTLNQSTQSPPVSKRPSPVSPTTRDIRRTSSGFSSLSVSSSLSSSTLYLSSSCFPDLVKWLAPRVASLTLWICCSSCCVYSPGGVSSYLCTSCSTTLLQCICWPSC